MLENCKTAQERWGGTHEMIDRWLSDRQQALISFFAIQDAQGKENLAENLQIFSQQLVDYVSEGHFEIYEQLFREAKEFDDGGLDLARELYPKIELTTQQLLNFNDRYASIDLVDANITTLKSDLSALGENMTERFDMEDQLIERLHTVHKKQLA
ncbi:sigma D regulator [Reinekea sp.]|jgi:regulator of sigma D|uniref:sigma D regulator n=1 Tax=Reinekea sp. TaxID=1970455 RepID=UPI002A812A27|nr:sigma D regulator [Reinekea sp.]